jgi:hypothetical protein
MALELHGTTGVSLVQDDAGMPPGTPLQVVSVHKSDTFSTSSSTFSDITGLSLSITPSSTSSKILVTGQILLGSHTGFTYIRLVRDSTAINIGDSASNRPRITAQFPYDSAEGQYSVVATPVMYLDSPSTTSATTYKIQLAGNSVQTNYVNRTHSDRDTTGYESRAASSLIAMEIAG